MRSIRKIQSDCNILSYFEDETNLEKTYTGYLFDKVRRTDLMYQYNVYIPQLKLTTRFNSLNEYNNYEKIQPNNCVVKSAILDVEFEEDCSKFVNNNAYIIELSNGLACNEIVISYEFQNEYQLAYIGFKNVENSRDFTVNNKFKILETVAPKK